MTVRQQIISRWFGIKTVPRMACYKFVCEGTMKSRPIVYHHTIPNRMKPTYEIPFCLHLEYPIISLAFLVLLHSFFRSLSFVRTFRSLSFIGTYRGLCFVSIFRCMSFASTVRNFLRNFRGRRSIDR